MANSLIPTLEIAPSQQMGAPVYVKFTLTNPTDTDHCVLRWLTPLEGLLGPSFVISHDGKPIPYDGICVLRGVPGPDDYVVVPAGSSVSATVDLSEAYAFDQPGTYEVRLATTLQDHYPIRGMGLVARPYSEHEALLLTSPVKTLELAPGPARLTVGAQQRAKEPQVYFPPLTVGVPLPEVASYRLAMAITPKFIGGTADQQFHVNCAWSVAQTYVLGAIQYLAEEAATGNYYNHYVTWFGTSDANRFSKVLSNYMNMHMWIAALPFTFDLTGPSCKDNDIARTSNGSRTIQVCSPFFSGAYPFTTKVDINNNMEITQVGALIHELSHDAAWTVDYGNNTPKDCLNLAATNPDRAISSPSNYMYYAMSAFYY
jgi:peptidyl-Lys metalloendopeptidase